MNIKNILNHPKGSITVFLTLLFTMLLSVVFITLQSAHYQCSKSFCDGITCTAEESALGHFYLPLFEDYSLFSVPMPDPVFTDLLSDYVQQNISSPVESLYYQLFSCSSYSVTPLKIYHLSDLDGKIFLSQIINAMKYQATGDSLDFLLSIGNLEDISKDYADISAVSPDSTEVPDKYDLSSFSSDPVSDSELDEDSATSMKDSLFSKIKEFMVNSSLLLYVENPDEISSNEINSKQLPSKTVAYNHHHSLSSLSYTTSEKALFLLYLNDYFSCYTDKKEKEQGINYEMEYILNGLSSDDANLLKTIQSIQHIRTGLNLAYLYSDFSKRCQAKTLAAAATSMIPVPFLVEFTQFAILSCWAYAEAVLDVRTLLAGETIPVFKTKSTWTLELEHLLTFDKHLKALPPSSGLCYRQYLLLLLYQNLGTDITYRTMDIIQNNINNLYSADFRIKNCITGMNYELQYTIPVLFSFTEPTLKTGVSFPYSSNQSAGY